MTNDTAVFFITFNTVTLPVYRAQSRYYDYCNRLICIVAFVYYYVLN